MSETYVPQGNQQLNAIYFVMFDEFPDQSMSEKEKIKSILGEQ